MKNSESMRGTTVLEVLIVFAIVSIMLGWTLPDPTKNLSQFNGEHRSNIAHPKGEALVNTQTIEAGTTDNPNPDNNPDSMPAGFHESQVTQILVAAEHEEEWPQLSPVEPGISPACRN